MSYRKKIWGLQHGQGMSEYIIIIALIAITSIAAVRVFGDSIRYQMAKTVQNFLGSKNLPAGVQKPKVGKTPFVGRDMSDFDKANE